MGSKRIASRKGPWRVRARSKTTGQFVSLEYARKNRWAVRLEKW